MRIATVATQGNAPLPQQGGQVENLGAIAQPSLRSHAHLPGPTMDRSSGLAVSLCFDGQLIIRNHRGDLRANPDPAKIRRFGVGQQFHQTEEDAMVRAKDIKITIACRCQTAGAAVLDFSPEWQQFRNKIHLSYRVHGSAPCPPAIRRDKAFSLWTDLDGH